jgi:hypothetical protein
MALLFNGTDALAKVIIDLSAYNQITLAFWMRVDTVGSAGDPLCVEMSANGGFYVDVGKSGSPNGGGFQVSLGTTSPSQVSWAPPFTKAAPSTAADFAPFAQKWCHYVIGLDRTTGSTAPNNITVYQNGYSPILTNDLTGNQAATNFPSDYISFGARVSTLYMKGAMEDIAIYNTLLTRSEMLQLNLQIATPLQVRRNRLNNYWPLTGASRQRDIIKGNDLAYQGGVGFTHGPRFADPIDLFDPATIGVGVAGSVESTRSALDGLYIADSVSSAVSGLRVIGALDLLYLTDSSVAAGPGPATISPAPTLWDRVKETTTSTASPFTLAGAQTGFKAFSSRLSDGQMAYVEVKDSAGAWQVGLASYQSAANTITFVAIYSSSNSDAAVTFAAGSKDILIDAPAAVIQPTAWNVKTDFGAKGDGLTDDTVAFQNMIDAAHTVGGAVDCLIPDGTYIWAGAFQDTSRQNAQVLLPTIAINEQPLSLRLRGRVPPVQIPSVIGTIAVPTNGAIIKSSKTGTGTLPSMLGGRPQSGASYGFNLMQLGLENLTFRTYDNPSISALQLQYTAAVDLQNVTVDTGIYNLHNVTKPTTTTAYAFILPAMDNGAFTRLNNCCAIGYYFGYYLGEHAHIDFASAWACIAAAEMPANNHATMISRFLAVWCPTGFRVTGNHYMVVSQYDCERSTAGDWFDPTITTGYDIDDAGGNGHGIINLELVLSGSGHSTSLRYNGAANITKTAI